MSESWLTGLLALNAAVMLFLLERVFNLTSKIGGVKADITKELVSHKEKINEMFEKQISEGILAHKRIDQIDRLVSAITDAEFGSSKNIAIGQEDFPETTRIRRIVKSSHA